eukprot:CAMPEP_0119121432 /NCGR_PEP_ID=MMETSP1310-20130426/2060_1 /TAXON_ID=464262 /ORGANISM="Genus nov. species nov., Strain RCC2339" /LENGTH=70 /DNA_ID=CAMNT_0007110995 /DNA_START=115 /DNA_END=327 /DNA_ORIENTATION=+
MDDSVEKCVVKAKAEEDCKPQCTKQLENYLACVKRIENHPDPEANCEAWWWDYQGCLDKCALPKIWAQLK